MRRGNHRPEVDSPIARFLHFKQTKTQRDHQSLALQASLQRPMIQAPTLFDVHERSPVTLLRLRCAPALQESLTSETSYVQVLVYKQLCVSSMYPELDPRAY